MAKDDYGVKDIRYFLDEENKYCQTKLKECEVWDDEALDGETQRDPIVFLRQRPFQREYDNICYKKELTKEYDLNDSELTMLGLFIMHHSRFFRDDYYGDEVPKIAQNMFEVLDSVVSKAPITHSKVLYRFCVDEDRHDMKCGDIITVPHNLTCTTDRWERHDNNIYVIQILPHDKTHAHDLYRMYPHNEREKQVNFLRGTSFQIENIESIEGTGYNIFVMNEIE